VSPGSGSARGATRRATSPGNPNASWLVARSCTPRAREERRRQFGDGQAQLLAVVEDEQGSPVAQFGDEAVERLLAGAVPQADDRGDRVGDARGLGGGDEIDEPDTIGESGESGEESSGDLERQARFPYPARPDKGEEAMPYAPGQQARDGPLPARAPDEGRARCGEIVRGGSAGRPPARRQRQERRARLVSEAERGSQPRHGAVTRHTAGPRLQFQDGPLADTGQGGQFARR